MNRPTALRWDTPRKSGRALYRGVMYTISTRQPHALDTKAGSAAQARVWWTTKMEELNREVEDIQTTEECKK